MICTNGNKAHSHATVIESKICYGLLPDPSLAAALVGHAPEPVTPRQLAYIIDLGGNEAFAKTLTKKSASAEIDRLKKEPKMAVARYVHAEPTPAYMVPPAPEPRDNRLEMVEMLIDSVRDGHYAVQPDSLTPYTFLRISRPKKGRYAGTVKFQTQHSEAYQTVAAIYPSDKRMRLYGGPVVLDRILQVIANSTEAARAYAKELNHCCRCNKELTDERSRHYGIGPECEKVWPDMLGSVDLENNGFTYEQLRAAGLHA
jgi:hypothetical protein